MTLYHQSSIIKEKYILGDINGDKMYTTLKEQLNELGKIARKCQGQHKQDCKKFVEALNIGGNNDKARKIINFFDELSVVSRYSQDFVSSYSDISQLDAAINARRLAEKLNALTKTLVFINDRQAMKSLNNELNESVVKIFKKNYSVDPYSEDNYDGLLSLQPGGRAALKAKQKSVKYDKAYDNFPYKICGGVKWSIILSAALLLFTHSKYLPFELMNKIPISIFLGIILGFPFGMLMGRLLKLKHINIAEKEHDKYIAAVSPLKQKGIKEYEEKQKKYIEEKIGEALPKLTAMNEVMLSLLQTMDKVNQELRKIISNNLNGLNCYNEYQLEDIKGYIQRGRASNIKEAINQYTIDKRIEKGFAMLQAQQAAAFREIEREREHDRQRLASVLSTLSSALKEEEKKSDAILASYKKQNKLLGEQNELLGEIAEEEKRRTRIVENW